jgi:hypothetical protein
MIPNIFRNTFDPRLGGPVLSIPAGDRRGAVTRLLDRLDEARHGMVADGDRGLPVATFAAAVASSGAPSFFSSRAAQEARVDR